MFMLLFMFNDLLDLFDELINDILSLLAPKIDSTYKPSRYLRR